MHDWIRLAPAFKKEVCNARNVSCPWVRSSSIAEDHKADEISALNSSSNVVPYWSHHAEEEQDKTEVPIVEIKISKSKKLASSCNCVTSLGTCLYRSGDKLTIPPS